MFHVKNNVSSSQTYLFKFLLESKHSQFLYFLDFIFCNYGNWPVGEASWMSLNWTDAWMMCVCVKFFVLTDCCCLLSSESLLLGSLFWLMSIVCLFLAPSLSSLNLKGASRPESGPVLEVQKIENKGAEYDFGYHLIILRRRYRGMRSRMKSSYYYSCSYGVVNGPSLPSVLDF